MNRSSPKKMNMDEGSMWQVKNKLYSHETDIIQII